MRWLHDHEDHLSEHHPLKWIALSGYRMVGIGDSLSEVLEQAASNGEPDPFVTRIPRKLPPRTFLVR